MRFFCAVHSVIFPPETQDVSTGIADYENELTTGLDAKTRRDVWKILSELKSKELTVFLTSHFMDEVKALCHKICILKKGKAVFHGTTEQAKEASGCEKFEDIYLALSGEDVTEE